MTRRRAAAIGGVLLLACCLPAPVCGKQIAVVFRYDDFSNWKSTAEFDAALIEAFRDHGMSATFSVIPFERQKGEGEDYYAVVPKKVLPLTPEKTAILLDAMQAGTLEIALHGYLHRETHPERPWTEFAGVPLSEQRRRIAEGKKSLEGQLNRKITLFVPPFNSYDAGTVQILEELGFETLSAGGLPAPEGDSALKFLPATCVRVDVLRQAVETARASAESDPVVVVMVHPHDFVETDKEAGVVTLEKFRELLAWIASQDDLTVRTLGAVAGDANRDLGMDHYRTYCQARPDKPKKLLPQTLTAGVARIGYYPRPETLSKIRLTLALRLVLWYGAIAAAACLAAFLVLRKTQKLAKPAAYGMTLALIALAAYTFRDMDVYYPGASAVAFVAGMCAAAWICFLYQHRRLCVCRVSAVEETGSAQRHRPDADTAETRQTQSTL